MNYYIMNEVDPQWLKEQFKKYMMLLERSHYQIAKEMKIDRNTLMYFEMKPEAVHYRSAMKIHAWIKKQEARLYGQGSI